MPLHNGGGGFLLEIKGKQGMGIGGNWVYNGGMDNFLSLFTLLEEGCQLPYFMKTPLPILPTSPSLFQILSTPAPSPCPRPCQLQPPPPLLFLLPWFFGWIGDHATFDVLFYLRIISSCIAPQLVHCNKSFLPYFIKRVIKS